MNESRLVIFHINTEMSFRGGEIQTLHLARGLMNLGHENCIFARPGSKILQEARVLGIPCFTLPMRGEWDLISGRTLRGLIRIQHPHLLHAHTAHACSIAMMSRWPNPTPPIVFSRRVSFRPRSFLRRKVKNVDALLAVSNSVRTQLVQEGIPADKIFVAESGTDFSKFDSAPDQATARKQLGISPDAFVIGNVGEFDRPKGQDALISTFSKFLKTHENAVLLFAGDGDEKQKCQSLAKELGCESSVVFTSFRPDVENIYPAMDVFFLSSTGEGWSGVLREAMACNIPVIALRQPSTEEQVQSGILVGKDLDEWQGAIEKLFQDPELRAQLAQKAREQVKTYTIENMIGKTLECYRQVLAYSAAR